MTLSSKEMLKQMLVSNCATCNVFVKVSSISLAISWLLSITAYCQDDETTIDPYFLIFLSFSSQLLV